MNWPRFSLGRMFVGMTAFAIVCWAFVIPANQQISMLILSAGLGCLCVTPIGICYRSGERRAFWVGATTFGWGYVLMMWLDDQRIIDLEGSVFFVVVRVVIGVVHPSIFENGEIRYVDPLVHSIAILVMSVVGGYVARYFYRTQDVGTDAA